VAALFGLVRPCSATAITVEGLTFSDELGSFRLISVTGTGRTEDPFVVVEEVTGPDNAILFIRGLTWRFGNRIQSHHLVGFALRKIAINRTESIWYEYELELREHLEVHSPFGDGLSFGQASQAGRPFTSDRFASNYDKEEPYDSVVFADGEVRPGEAVVFNVVVTDTTPDPHFYLMQRREQEIVAPPSQGRLAVAQEEGKERLGGVLRRLLHEEVPAGDLAAGHVVGPAAPDPDPVQGPAVGLLGAVEGE
jgi:hypothetical protein